MDPRKILGPVAAVCFGVCAYQMFEVNKPLEQRIIVAAFFSGLGAVSGGMYLKSLRHPNRDGQNERNQLPARRDETLENKEEYSPKNLTTNIDLSDRRQIHIHYHQTDNDD